MGGGRWLGIVALLMLAGAYGVPSASALYAGGDGYSLNAPMRVPELHIGGLDVGWTLLRLVQRMNDAEQRIDAQQAQIDGLLGANARLQANLTGATERVRQLEALNGNATGIFAGIVRDSLALAELQLSSSEMAERVAAAEGASGAINATLRAQAGFIAALQGSNSSIALRLSKAEQLTVGSSPLVTAVLSQAASLLSVRASNATLFSGLAALQSSNATLALRVSNAERLVPNSSPLVTAVIAQADGLAALRVSNQSLFTGVAALRSSNASLFLLASALQSSNSTLFGRVAALQSADGQLAARLTIANDTLSAGVAALDTRASQINSSALALGASLTSVNSSLGLRISRAEQLAVGSSPLVAAVLAHTDGLSALRASNATLFTSVVALQISNLSLALRMSTAELGPPAMTLFTDAMMASGWTRNLGADYPPRWWIDRGVVHLDGIVRPASTQPSVTRAFTLPVPLRPLAPKMYFFTATFDATFASVYIDSTGGLTVQTASATTPNSWLSLVGIRFPLN